MTLSKLIAEDSFQGKLPTHISSPVVAAYLLFIYSFPFNAGSHINLLLFSGLLILFISFVFSSTRKHKFSLLKQLKNHHPFLYYLLFSLALTSAISLMNVLLDDVSTKHKIAAALRYIMYIFIVLYTFALARFCIVYKVSHTLIFFCFILGILTLTILQFLTYHLGTTIEANEWFLHPPFGHHIRDTGNMAAISAVLCIIFALFIKKHQPLLQLTIYLCMLASWTFLIWTGGRTAIVSALIVSSTILVYASIYLKKDLKKIPLILLCVGLALPLSNSLSVFPWNGIQRASATLSTAQPKTISETETSIEAKSRAFTTGRSVTWKLSIEAVKKSPWFGLGPNGFYFIPERFYGDHPHNLVIQFLVEWGVIGASLLLVLLGYIAWHGIRRIPEAFREKDTSYIICSAVVLTLTLNSLTGGAYFMLQPLFCLVTAFAVFPFAKINKASENSN